MLFARARLIRALDTLRKSETVERRVENIRGGAQRRPPAVEGGLTTHWNGRAFSRYLMLGLHGVGVSCAPFNSGVMLLSLD